MCGIAGIVNFDNKKVNQDDIQGMMRTMKHRGPDDEGVLIENNFGLGFVRLSILDLSSSGHQPMTSFNNQYVIIFNGEVYNYLEIKNELTPKYSFKSQTDTEVVLNSYIEWGEDCLEKFNGMFAFVIYNRKDNTLFGARDRFGIKPFYYQYTYKHFIFASEIRPIINLPGTISLANHTVIFNYLHSNRTNYSDETFFKGISKMRPGSKFNLINDELRIEQWYNIDNKSNVVGFQSSEEYYSLYVQSTKQQLRSDVPIGISLSGGLDSSSIATVLIENKLSNLHSYSAIYNKGDVGDEQEYIELFKNKGVQMHFVKPVVEDLLKDLDNYIYALEEPVPGTSEYAEYKVMQLAREHSTVILNGQGADEVLGGYDYFYSAYLKELISKLKFIDFIDSCIHLHRHNKLYVALKYLFFFQCPVKLKCYLMKKRNDVFNEKYYRKYKPEGEYLINKYYRFKDLKTFFKNHLKYKFEHHLMWADKSGMYFSLETRFPFIDHNLIEKTLTTNDSKILNNGWTKAILRDALAGKLDDKIRLRKDKIGYETPEKEWFKEIKFKNFINDVLNSKTFNNRPFFDANKIKTLYTKHLLGKENNSNLIWKVIHLELWLRKFIDDQPNSSFKKSSYVVVTPAKNEEKHLRKTIESVVNQTVSPTKWVIVDDGSTDTTFKIIQEYAAKFNWIHPVHMDTMGQNRSGGSKVVKAFYSGLREVNVSDYEFIVKLDADIVLPENYFETMISEFISDNSLGICGGTIWNKDENGRLTKEKTNRFHVRGALKMIREQCWHEIGGFKETWNWDGLDIAEARFNNWNTKSINIPVIHLRPTSSAYNQIEHAYKSGYESYKMGADLILTVARTLVRYKSKPYFKIGNAFLKGYISSKKNKEPLIISRSTAKYLNYLHYKRFISKN